MPRNTFPVHADGGDCQGMPLVNGRCPSCGISPDAQSTELRTVATLELSMVRYEALRIVQAGPMVYDERAVRLAEWVLSRPEIVATEGE